MKRSEKGSIKMSLWGPRKRRNMKRGKGQKGQMRASKTNYTSWF